LQRYNFFGFIVIFSFFGVNNYGSRLIKCVVQSRWRRFAIGAVSELCYWFFSLPLFDFMPDYFYLNLCGGTGYKPAPAERQGLL